MPFDRLPESVQTLYAELLEQSIHADAAEAAIGAPSGSFVRKKVKGRTYWYLQRMEGDRKRQHYVGADSDTLLDWIAQVKRAREIQRIDDAGRARLCRMLGTGGALVESTPVTKVLRLLAESGVFRHGGVLVGTHALRTFGNMLGVRLHRQALRTHDVDIAQEPAIGVALASGEGIVDVGKKLVDSELGFLEVPTLDPRQPTTSFMVRGRELRVDFLTPLRGPESSEPQYLPVFREAAQPLRFLDYLIAETHQAVVVGGHGILVNVPDPARFAFHKLWTSQKRPATQQTKARKDLDQAAQVLEVLLEDRPQDLAPAWEPIQRTKSQQRRIRSALRHVDADLRRRLAEILEEPEPGAG